MRAGSRRGRPAGALLLGAVAVIIAVAVSLLAGCGGRGDEPGSDGAPAALPERTEATLVLDFIPNAVHAGIYCALERGYYDDANVELEIVEPTSTSDTLKLIERGKAAFGIADGIDVGQQIDRGLGAKAILALVQRPLGGVITREDSGIDSPGELEGRTVGITGVPSDRAVLDTVVSDDGGDPAALEDVSIGFNTVIALRSGRVDAITGYPPADGTQLELQGVPVSSFALDEWGGPTYPGLVFFSTQRTIDRDPELMRAFVAATTRGYQRAIAQPEKCLDALVARVPEIDRELAEAQLDAYLPLFEGGAPFGVLQADALEDLSAFLRATGLTEREIPPRRYATDAFVGGSAR